MTRRWSKASLLASVIALVALAAQPVAAQSGAARQRTPSKSGNWTPPRTPWGDPDLQGTWSTDAAISIPLQRPAQFAGRATLTDEEFNQKAEQLKARHADAERIKDGNIGEISADALWQTTRAFRQTSLIIEPADGQFPPFTPAAQATLGTIPRGTYGNGPLDGPEDFGMYDRCITRGVVGSVLPVVYGNGQRIVQGPGYVAFLNEMIHEHRIIPLDGRGHVDSKIRTYLGDSRGHWEGNTLVVETTNLRGNTTSIGLNGGNGGQAPRTSDALRLVERFTRLEPDLLEWEVLVDDPDTYTRPIRIAVPLTSPPGYQVLAYDCHEGNKAVMQALGGERVEDRALAEDLKKGIVRARKPVQNGLGVGGAPTESPSGAAGAGPR